MREHELLSALRGVLRAYVRENPRFQSSDDEIKHINNLSDERAVSAYVKNCGIDADVLVFHLFRVMW